METTMGRVLTAATVEHLGDLWDLERGRITVEAVRRLEITDALVDTGATTLALPTRMIQQLGLTKSYEKNASVRVIFDASVARFGLKDRIQAYRGTIAMFAKQPLASSFRCRLAFVDGDHGYEAVRSDIETISRWLVPGGWICFDDAFTGYEGVDRALQRGIVDNPAFDIKQQLTRKMFVARRRAEPVS